MSASAITAAQAELISSLSQDDIPIKLRCAICSRLAVNAFRLPCCDQSICETCQSTLPSTCPVCEHSPVASEDCKPHKSLRTTIKVFLRTEEKKREALRLKEAKNTPPDTPVESEAAPAALSAALPQTVPSADDLAAGNVKPEASTPADTTELISADVELAQFQEEQKDIPQPSIEEIAPGQEPTLSADADVPGDAATGDEEGKKGVADGNTDGQSADEAAQTPAVGTAFGFDANSAAGFAGGFGDMNQMQMMMAMQNGMAPNAFGNFPMMGMPGMNMDPMMMQTMLMNGGFGAGMGVNNGMNMGMGMGGFEGGMGNGFNNGWNGQQSWNVGADNFNYPNAAGMGSGDYAANNSGYASHAAGYNQGNYGRGNHYSDYQNNSSGYRGRGRGRGGYGRGGYGYGTNDSSQQYPQQPGPGYQHNGPVSETGSVPTGPKADTTPAGNVDEFGREIRQTSDSKDTRNESEKPKDDTSPRIDTGVTDDEAAVNSAQRSEEIQPEHADETAPKPIQTLDELEAPYAQNGNYPGYHNNQYAGRGGYYPGGGMQPPAKPVDVPINAPTGPKAMREGLPNTSIAHLRARGLVPAPAVTMTNGSTSVAPEAVEQDEKEKERSRSPSREKSPSRSRSRERKRSRSTERQRSHRRKHRSASPTEDDKETERRRQKRRDNDRRRRRDEEAEERSERDDIGFGDKTTDEGKGYPEQDRSRTASPSASKRSSHRSHKEKDKHRERERERERDGDREHRSSHKHRSSRRSHRDDKSRSRDRDRDHDRDHDRRREREREHRHRRSRHDSEALEDNPEKVDATVSLTPVEREESKRLPSIVPNGTSSIEIKGASSRRKNTLDEIVIPTGPRSSRQNDMGTSRSRQDDHRSLRHRMSEKEVERERPKEKPKPRSTSSTAPAVRNPHEEEREARNRERLLKEAQRMAGLSGGGHKRSRDEGEDASRRSKKKGRRGGGVEESDEERIARLEAERESARW